MSRSFVPTVIVGDKASTSPHDGLTRSARDDSGLAAQARRLPTLSCVVPCHNEAANLALLLPLLSATLDECSLAWEIILVDDGSRDHTAALLAEWSERPGYRAIILSRNFGKEAALTAGLEAAAGEVTVMLDADLQHPPALIKTFVQRWQDGADVVYAVRADRSDETLFKRAGTRAFYKLMNTADRFEVPANAGDFRLMDRKVVDALMSLPERNRFMKGLYAWVGFNTVAVPYVPNERAEGVSHFGPLRLIRMSFDGLTAFTNWPLRAVSATGFVLAVVAFVYGMWETVSYFVYGNQVSGWTTIVVGLMLFSGIQLLSLGIVGEYVGRIFEEVKARPLYVVSKESGQGLKATSS
jgi:glycosyltransferase involved in cell wall biosynthesis